MGLGMRKSVRRWYVNEVVRLRAENHLLREGLRQVAEGDYPADAGAPEAWAQEVLMSPEAVRWDEAASDSTKEGDRG